MLGLTVLSRVRNFLDTFVRGCLIPRVLSRVRDFSGVRGSSRCAAAVLSRVRDFPDDAWVKSTWAGVLSRLREFSVAIGHFPYDDLYCPACGTYQGRASIE